LGLAGLGAKKRDDAAGKIGKQVDLKLLRRELKIKKRLFQISNHMPASTEAPQGALKPLG